VTVRYIHFSVESEFGNFTTEEAGARLNDMGFLLRKRLAFQQTEELLEAPELRY
jgi:hypothetical protein